MAEPADDLNGGGTELDVVRAHLGPGGPAAAAEAAEEPAAQPQTPEPPAEPGPWTGPSQEEWQRVTEFAQQLAPLADYLEQQGGGPESDDLDDDEYDYDEEAEQLAAMGFTENEIDQILEADDEGADDSDAEPEFDGSYQDYLNTVLQHQVQNEVSPLLEELEDIKASQAEREARQQAREQAQVQAAQERAQQGEFLQQAHQMIGEYARKVGNQNVDVNAVLDMTTATLVDMQEAMLAQGYTTGQIMEEFVRQDAGTRVMEMAVNGLTYQAISDRVLRRTGFIK